MCCYSFSFAYDSNRIEEKSKICVLSLPLSSMSIEFEEGRPSHRRKITFCSPFLSLGKKLHYRFESLFHCIIVQSSIFRAWISRVVCRNKHQNFQRSSLSYSISFSNSSPSLCYTSEPCCCASISLLFLFLSAVAPFLFIKNIKSLTFDIPPWNSCYRISHLAGSSISFLCHSSSSMWFSLSPYLYRSLRNYLNNPLEINLSLLPLILTTNRNHISHLALINTFFFQTSIVIFLCALLRHIYY